MATAAADVDRVAVATIATDAGTWGNDGGGGGVADEPDFVYQGSTSQSRKVSTSRIGREYSGGTTRDASGAGTHTHFLFKINITNYGALLTRSSPAAGIKIGSDAANYDEWYVFGSDNYPLAGGWQFVVIDPNVTGYVDDATNGTPVLTAVDYYSLLADFSATSKSENLIIDAIDLGTGLVITGNTPDGDFADFLSLDEGTSGNRWGFIRSLDGIYFVNGRLAIGENTSGTAVATGFTDATGQVLVWENGMAATGFYAFRVNLGASTTVSITDATFDSIGEKNNTAGRGYTTTEDTRLDVSVAGTTGTLALTNCQFKNCQDFVMTSAVTFDGGGIETEAMTQSNALVKNCRITTTSVASAATISDPTFPSPSTDDENLHDIDFVQGGAGHSLEIGAAGTYEFVGLSFTGYNGANGQTDSAIFINVASGTVTINVTGGGDSPTYRLPGGSTATVNIVVDPVTTLINAKDILGNNVENARVLLVASDGTGDLPYQQSVSTLTRSGTTATCTTGAAHGLTTGDIVLIRGADQDEYNIAAACTVTSTTQFTYVMAADPGASGTGTITVTGGVFNDLTNASGNVTDVRAWTNPQPVTGWIRKSTISPYYQQTNLSGTISTTNGLTINAQMLLDE